MTLLVQIGRFLLCVLTATALVPRTNAQPNAVGYINVPLNPGINVLGIQLKNRLSTVSTLFPNLPDGTTIHRFIEGQLTTNGYLNGQWDDPDEVIAPGEGILLDSPTSDRLTVTLVGEILQGDLTNAIPEGLSLKCNIIPQAGKVTGVMGLRLSSFDNLYLWKGGAWKVFTYLPTGNWSPIEPVVATGEAFLLNTARATNWVTHFIIDMTSASAPLTALTQPSVGAGTVNFANGAAQVNAPITFQGSGAGVEGANWTAELLVQTNSDFVLMATAPFEPGPLAGYFFAGSVSVPGTAPGDSAIFKVRVRNSLNNFAATSDPVTVTLGGNKAAPANLIGLRGLQIPVPARLSILKTGDQVILSWPEQSPEMLLEFSTDFPANWQPLPASRATNANLTSVTLQTPENRRFFRLRSF